MSEMELHIMRNRLDRGRDNKAQRGELFHGVPMGYVLLPSGEVAFDPDEHARDVVRLVFDKFAELGSIYGMFHWLIRNDIRLPVRARRGAKKGQLEWQRPSIPTLAQMLRHPIYAGAYAYGRRPIDPKRKYSASSRYRPWAPMEQWKVLIKDRRVVVQVRSDSEFVDVKIHWSGGYESQHAATAQASCTEPPRNQCLYE
jgi:hypothetical protein